jgi:lysozyme
MRVLVLGRDGLPPSLILPAALAALAVLLSECGGSGGDRRAARTTSQALVQCPAATVEGIDVFDGQGAIDWARVADAGVAFAYIKATQGTYDTQTTFAKNWAGAGAAGVARGAYHFFDPTEDGAAQAAHFFSVLSAAGGIGPRDLSPVLDVECPDGDADCLFAGGSGAAPAADVAARIRAFLAAAEPASGRVPAAYTFASYFSENAIDATVLETYPLFLAYPTDGACLPVPAPWSRATLWQYSWSGAVAGVAGPVDRDRLLGSLDDLRSPDSASVSTEATPQPSIPRTPPATPRTPDATDAGPDASGSTRAVADLADSAAPPDVDASAALAVAGPSPACRVGGGTPSRSAAAWIALGLAGLFRRRRWLPDGGPSC